MRKESMTPKERWLAVLHREKPDRAPMDYWSTPEASARLIKHLGFSQKSEGELVKDLNMLPGCEVLLHPSHGVQALHWALQYLHVDFVITPVARYVGPALPTDTDVFGVHYRSIDYGTGEYSEAATHPLAAFNSVEEIKANYPWPNPDWWDYAEIAQQIEGWEDYPIRGGGSEPFLLYKYLRGDEQAMIDLALNPEIVEYCLGKLFELAYQDTLRTYEAIPGKVSHSYVAEDMGGQDNLMYSKAHIRRFLLPGMKRVADLAHQGGAFVFHHNDGACRSIIPDMIETVGIQALNPIQWRSKGMEREGLKRDFGDRLIFHGAVDNQYTLPFGSVEQVRQEVQDNLRILGAGGGYILAPCHNIQPVSPPENIVAMYQAGYEYGWN
ncbi:MAG: uroporphyrinogen decarboxylase family protein [Anaerolineaceae bacterium]